jgi:hypothetical protein
MGDRPIGENVVFSPSGNALAWRYRGKSISLLSPTGEAIGEVNTEFVVAQDETARANIFIQCARIDEPRGLWLVGTSHGLAVGSLDPNMRQPIALLCRVDCLGSAGVLAIGSFLGRVLLVTDGDETGSDGGVLLENGFGEGLTDAKAFASGTKFSSSSVVPDMGRPSAATMLAPDVVWAVALGGVWEWKPGGWRQLDVACELPRPHETRRLPVIVTDLSRSEIWCIRPRAKDRYRDMSVAIGPVSASFNNLCPDPSGGGVWLWNTSPNPPDLGYMRFATPHAITDTLPEGTRHPASVRVSRLSHRESDGTTRTPVARNGAVLLPVGADFLLGRAGHWVETDLSALADATYIELTPGAESADAAWLAIRRNGQMPQQLVTIDIDEDTADEPHPKLVVSEFDFKVPSEARTSLVPDSTGSVWMAWAEGQSWTLRRIQATGLGETLEVDLPNEVLDSPRFMFLDEAPGWFGSGLLLTDTGGCRIAHADRLSAVQNGFRLLAPEVRPWVRLWQRNPFESEPQVEYQVILSRRWGIVAGDTRVVLLRRPSPNASDEAFGVSFEAESPRLKPAAVRLDTGSLQGFHPRLWFTGIDEYVIGQYDLLPGKPARMLALPVDGVSAVRSADWLRKLSGDLRPDVGVKASGLALNTLGDELADAMVVASGRNVGFENLSALSDSLIIVPTTVDVHFSADEVQQTYDVRRGLFASPLPANATHLTVRVAPNYGDWWRPDWERVSLRDRASTGEVFPLSSDGDRAAFQVPLTFGVHRELALATDAWPDPIANELPIFSFDVAVPVAGVSAWWIPVALLLGIAGIGTAVAISSEVDHRVRGLLGSLWVFEGGDGNASVIIRSDGPDGAMIRGSVSAVFRPTALPPRQEGLSDLTKRWQEEAVSKKINPFLVTAYVDEKLFRHNWGQCLSDKWTDPNALVHSGTIFGLGPEDKLPGFPIRKGNMQVTALGCQIPDGEACIPMRDLIVNDCLEAFRGVGFSTGGTPVEATREDLIAALKESDVCLIVGHARDGSFLFKNSKFGSADWRELGDSVQCQFMILVGCGLGDLATTESPLLFDVLKKGVTCLACTSAKQNVGIAWNLLPLFCREWRQGRTRGPTIAEALRKAADSVSQSTDNPDTKNEINSYVILGTPTLRLAFRQIARGTRS